MTSLNEKICQWDDQEVLMILTLILDLTIAYSESDSLSRLPLQEVATPEDVKRQFLFFVVCWKVCRTDSTSHLYLYFLQGSQQNRAMYITLVVSLIFANGQKLWNVLKHTRDSLPGEAQNLMIDRWCLLLEMAEMLVECTTTDLWWRQHYCIWLLQLRRQSLQVDSLAAN